MKKVLMNDEMAKRERARLDPDHEIRVAVLNVENDLAPLPAAGAVLKSWGELVKALDLAPAPALRDCPVCGRACMRAATLCGHCWTKLDKLADATP
jgi:hypothetical protein